MANEIGITYRAPKTLAKFMADDSFVRCVVGPLGSGKSSASSSELLRRACMQTPSLDGIRRTRWAVIRNTYRELADTTRRTFEQWVPSKLGIWHESSNRFIARFGDCHAEFLFRALDKPGDVDKLKSLELTGAWVNEGIEIPKSVFDMLQGRVGRYPSKAEGGVGASWFGIIIDTNPPDQDHWLYKMFLEQQDTLPDFKIWIQPGGLDPLAENVENLPTDYYKRIAQGKSQEWINVFVNGKFGFIVDGKPCYPEWNPRVHVDSTLDWLPRAFPVLIGVDFGLTPAACWGQQDSDGQVQILHEYVTEDMGAVRFAENLGIKLRNSHSREHPMRGWGDPAGMQRSQVDERSPFDVLHAAQLPIDAAPTNDWLIRRETVGNLLTRLTMRGRPSLVIHPRCTTLIKAMGGGYCMRRLQVAGGEKFAEYPDKGRFSHIAEALQYLCVGEGLDREVLEGYGGGRAVPREVIRSSGRIQRGLGDR